MLRSLVDLVLPDTCRVCGAQVVDSLRQQGICQGCIGEVKYRMFNGCRKCGIAFVGHVDSDHLCGNCLRSPPAYERAIVICEFEDPVRMLLHRLKYQADTCVLPALAAIINRAEWDASAKFDWIIPVPLHPSRLRSRGFNQSILLARLLFSSTRDTINPFLLQRVRKTVPQTGLNGAARRKNLHGAFAVQCPELLKGRKVCLVDDVLTTGTTVCECSTVLLREGVSSVEVVTVAGVRAKG
jgi:ComF family protein